MEKKFILSALVLLAVLAIAAGCQSLANNMGSSPLAGQTYSDPFTYCEAVGTIDAPDERYTGSQVPDEIINGFRKAAGLEDSTEPIEMLRKTTVWRCMDGKVYACNIGANLPCSSKANTNKTPTPGMYDYCKAKPNSDFIPMSETGHDTIYSWRCASGTPEVIEQVENVDPAGYIERIWYPIEIPTP